MAFLVLFPCRCLLGAGVIPKGEAIAGAQGGWVDRIFLVSIPRDTPTAFRWMDPMLAIGKCQALTFS